jgi:hypothetical protein
MDIEEILGNEENKAKLFEGLKAKGFDVFDEAKKAELINNSTTEKIKAREFELKVGYEKDIQDLTGEVKGVNEKTHEYLKRVLGGSLSKAKDLEAKLNSSPNADDTIKQLNNLSFDEQGNAVLLDAEGKTLRNESNNMNPFTIEEVLSKELDKFIAVERTVEGASTNTPNPANPNADVPKDLETFVKSKVPKTEGEVQKFVQDYYISKNQNPRGREAIKNFANISKMLGF